MSQLRIHDDDLIYFSGKVRDGDNLFLSQEEEELVFKQNPQPEKVTRDNFLIVQHLMPSTNQNETYLVKKMHEEPEQYYVMKFYEKTEVFSQ